MGVLYVNGIQRIIDRIEADAADERAQIAAEAEARCATIEAAYAEAAQAEYQKITARGEKTASQLLERRAGAAATEAKKQILATKQEMVQAAFDRAAWLLSELPDDRYIPLLARLAFRASRTGTETLVFSPRDVSRVGEAVKDAANALLRQAGKTADLRVSPETRNIRGGVIVISGNIETNCSADSLVSMQRSALSGKVAEMLFS
jgi:V/A-type H+-transporting ATPase subunit E